MIDNRYKHRAGAKNSKAACTADRSMMLDGDVLPVDDLTGRPAGPLPQGTSNFGRFFYARAEAGELGVAIRRNLEVLGYAE